MPRLTESEVPRYSLPSDPFIGTWHLVSINFYQANGAVVKLYGNSPRGMLMYDAQGHMNGQVMQLGRPALPQGRATANARDDYHAILRGYIAYFGTYTVDETAGIITHHVVGSLVPNWVGTTQVRLYEFSNDGARLTLRTLPSQLRGETLAGELIWERAEPSATSEPSMEKQ